MTLLLPLHYPASPTCGGGRNELFWIVEERKISSNNVNFRQCERQRSRKTKTKGERSNYECRSFDGMILKKVNKVL